MEEKKREPLAAPNLMQSRFWAILQELGRCEGVTEIICNGPQRLFVEKHGAFYQLDVALASADLMLFVQEVASLNLAQCNDRTPILDGSLPDGSRVNIIVPPFVEKYPAITIRRYDKKSVTFKSAKNIFGLGPLWVEFLRSAVRAHMNLIVAGGTGVGKTTCLNLLLAEVAQTERIVTIEDTRELYVANPNVVHLLANRFKGTGQTSLTAGDLVRNSLRMRPDRIVLGEVRGPELFDMLQAMNTGHAGSMATIHANSPMEAIARMVTLYLLAGYDVPIKAIRAQIASAITFLIQLSRSKNGQRVVTEVSEITGMDGDVVLFQKIGQWQNEQLQFSQIVPSCRKKLESDGGLDRDFFSRASRVGGEV